MRTRRADHARGSTSEYLPEREGAAPDEQFGLDEPMTTPDEQAIGIHHPARFYAPPRPRCGTDAARGSRSTVQRIAAMWARASAVAAANPNAWLRRAPTSDHIATVDERNRPIASPYPKLMTSNLNVDQGGAVIMCSAAAAERLGVPRDRWVFPWSGAGAADHSSMTARWALDESPAMRLVGREALGRAGVASSTRCALLDLYSCFPVAVQVAQREIGIPTDRDWTITGGLTFAAGPMNCYCILPLTRAVELLRATPGERAFLTGNGGYFSKHSAIVLSGSPSPSAFSSGSPQADVDALPARQAPTEPVPVATLEAYTVLFDRDMQPERAILASLDDEGRRHWSDTTDPSTIDELLTTDACGTTVEL